MVFVYLIIGSLIMGVTLVYDLKNEEKNFFGKNKGIVEKVHLLIVIISSIFAIIIYFQTVYPIFTGEKKLESVTKELGEVSQDNDKLINSVTTLENNEKELMTSIENLEDDKEKLTSSMNGLNELLEEKNRKLEDVSQDNDKLINSVTTLENNEKELTTSIENLEDDKEKLTTSIGDLNKQLKEINQEFRSVYSMVIFEKLTKEYYGKYNSKSYTNQEIKEKVILFLKKIESKQKSPKALIIINNALDYIQNVSKVEDYLEGKFLIDMYVYCLYPPVREKTKSL